MIELAIIVKLTIMTKQVTEQMKIPTYYLSFTEVVRACVKHNIIPHATKKEHSLNIYSLWLFGVTYGV